MWRSSLFNYFTFILLWWKNKKNLVTSSFSTRTLYILVYYIYCYCRVSSTIEPGRSLLQFVTTNCLKLSKIKWNTKYFQMKVRINSAGVVLNYWTKTLNFCAYSKLKVNFDRTWWQIACEKRNNSRGETKVTLQFALKTYFLFLFLFLL